jgi:lysophospholipase L1-like esterase
MDEQKLLVLSKGDKESISRSRKIFLFCWKFLQTCMNKSYRKAFFLPFFLFWILGCTSVNKYIKADEVLDWEEDIRVFDSLNALEPVTPNTLLVTGSSSVRLWNTIHEDLEPYRVMQRGYGGAKLNDFNYYADRIVQPGTMNAILVFVANDISGGDHDRTPREVLRLFKKLVVQLRERNPATPVFWIEITPTPSRWHVIDQIRKANDLIRAYCEKSGDLHFIETYDVYINQKGYPDSAMFRNDMLHLNRQGYERWAERIKLNLKEAGIDP